MAAPEVRHRAQVCGIGELAIVNFERDAHTLIAHRWLTRDHARFWGMQSLSHAQIDGYFRDLDASPDFAAFIGMHDGAPAFLVERYAPAAEAIGAHYDVQPGDVGMHILVAPPERRIHGFTWAVFREVMAFLFADPTVARVVVEPDVANAGIHPLNKRAGFVYHRQVDLPGKRAWFASCSREDFEAARTCAPAVAY